MEKKYKMPTVHDFLKKKIIYDKKKDPVWVFLEREMRENIEKKPYNEKVGSWLKYMKELKFYYYCEAKRQYRTLCHEVGPPWYCELSSRQREVLDEMKAIIHQDLIEELPTRMRIALSDLGLTLIFPDSILMHAMLDSVEDPGLFMWNLYTNFYKMSPSQLRSSYDMNAMIMMSSLVVIDLEECIECLLNITKKVPRPPPPPKKEPKKYHQPNVRYGEYLQKIYVPFYSNHADSHEKKKPMPLENKIRLRSAESYERLRMDSTFLEKRRERNMKEKQSERVCHYKFWEPPSTLRNTDPKMAAYVIKLKMYKKRAKPRFLKYKAPFANVQYQIGNVSFTGGHPRFILNNVVMLQTGFIPINGGVVLYNGEFITHILGYWKFPREIHEKCDLTCDCLAKWDSAVTTFLHSSLCKCGHLYDYYHEKKAVDKCFYPPTRHGPFWIDKAKVYQLDPMEDFIRHTFKDALLSAEPTPVSSMPTIAASRLKERELLASFLADLSDTPLLIPHLPKSNLLNNLQEWVRKRIKGNITPGNHKQMLLKSQRRWLDLKHIDFKALAYRIPFTNKQLHNINWSQRGMVQKLFHVLLHNFTTRNRLKQVEQTRLWWPTMKHDVYPSEAFLNIFFTYMSARMKDTFWINPYSSDRTAKYGAKTCPL